MPTFRRVTRLPVPPGQVWAWHERPSAFERLTPPWEPIRVVSREGEGLALTLQIEVPIALGLRQRFFRLGLGG